MSEHFNKLTPAEAERLAMLAEEAGEIVQIVGKILRHGYDSKHPNDLAGPDNRDMLLKEITDLESVISMMVRAEDLPFHPSGEDVDEAYFQKLTYAHHQPAE